MEECTRLTIRVSTFNSRLSTINCEPTSLRSRHALGDPKLARFESLPHRKVVDEKLDKDDIYQGSQTPEQRFDLDEPCVGYGLKGLVG